MDIRNILWKVGETVDLWCERYLASLGLILYGGKGDAPAAPDYVGAAKQEGAASAQTALINAILGRPNQATPYGTQKWSQSGTFNVPSIGGQPGFDIPLLSSSMEFTPGGKNLFDAEMRARQGLADVSGDVLGDVQRSLSQPFSIEGMPDDYNQQVADAIYNRSARYMDPQFAQSEDKLRSDLVNRGFSVGTQGYTDAFNNFADAKDRAYATARDTAQVTGAQQGLRERQQSIQEMLLERTQPLSELSSLMTGSAPQMPQFGQYGQGTAQAPNILGATQAGAQHGIDIYNADVGSQNALMGTLGQLGSAGLMAYFF